MIKETSFYMDDFPVNIRIVHAEEYPLHFHQDIEFIYVLKGEINLKCGYFTYLLKEGSIFTLNGREVHGLYQTGSDNIVALVQIDNYYFSHYFARLSGSCYRTYTNDSNDSRLDQLKLFFINILSEALKKEPGYKHQVIDQINQLIAYLNEFFHYFSFEDKVVVSSRNDNPLFVERLSRMINRIYEKHADKLTLEDLSKHEHLSTFYISHLITEGTGMNFREFLCFARVEFSEMLLLDTNKRINIIAREVGFSTTAYYRKYFQKWFGLAPEDYRKKYMNVIQTSGIPAKLKPTEPDAVIKLLRNHLETLNKQNADGNPAKDLRLDIQLNSDAPSLRDFTVSMVPHCRMSVLKKNFNSVVTLAHDLKIKELLIIQDNDDPDFNKELPERLKAEGINFKTESGIVNKKTPCFGLDSIAANPYVLKLGLTPQCNRLSANSLIDEDSGLLHGEDGIFTSSLIPKPSYFAYKSLQLMEGELIHWGKYHAVTRQTGKDEKSDSFCILVFNQSEETEALCKRPSSMEETIEKINGFDDVLEMSIHLNGLKGHYQIMKYRVNSENCLLCYAAKAGLSRRIERGERSLLTWLASPKIDIASEEISSSLYLNVSLKGLESECIIISKIEV